MASVGLRCLETGERYPVDAVRWRADSGGVLDLDWHPSFDPGSVRDRDHTVWRYREVIPLNDDRAIVSLGEGYTPLVEADIAGRTVMLKMDSLLPTGSYKDRGATVLISKAMELGITHVVEDSSGNAGASIAAYCARAEIECEIIASPSAPAAKLAQIGLYGATLTLVEGPREALADAAIRRASSVYYASHVWNPFFLHGTKTVAYEICEQRSWSAPDAVILPVGNGALLLGVYLGFTELRDSGVIRTVPRLIGVQAGACAPLAAAFENGMDRPASVAPGPTVADGIAIARPARGRQILDAVRHTDGAILSVGEGDIARWKTLAGRRGFAVEPTSAATLAGAERYLSTPNDNERIVVIITGHGLKVPGVAAQPPVI